LDYLGEEVLKQQSDEVKDFLLKTSILERFSSSLCDAVTGSNSSQAVLDDLEKQNLFLVTLDNERCWYRYHHLFQELLLYQLEQAISRALGTSPEAGSTLAELHLRAANWFESHDLLNEAVHHLLSAGEFDRVAGIIENQAHHIFFIRGQTFTLTGWLDALPDTLFYSRPRISVTRAWVLFSQNQYTTGLKALETAEQAIKDRHDAEAAVIAGEIALVRGVFAQLSNRNYAVMREQAIIAWERLPEDQLILRGLAAWLLGASYYQNAEFDIAEKYLSQAIQLCQEAGNVYITLIAIADYSGVLREMGRCREAYTILLRIVKENSSIGFQPHPILGHLHINLGQILLQWNQLKAAEHHLELGIEMVKQGVPEEIFILGLLALPYLRLAQGRWEEAIRLAEECLARVESHTLPYLPPMIRAGLLKFWIRIGRRDQVQSWLSACTINLDDPITYARQGEYANYARALLWQGQPEGASKVLSKLEEYSHANGRIGKPLYLLVLHVLVFQQQNQLDSALSVLEESLKMAQPEGYIRVFVDEGEPMEALLKLGESSGRWVKAGLDTYTDQLLTAIHEDLTQLHSQENREVNGEKSRMEGIPAEPFEEVDGLSEREKEVLRLAANGLSNPKIGKLLSLTTGTIKTHMHHIYSKLGVDGRFQAITLAKERHLLE
jgi:LuxR family maltose regulon positive regulatory protein